MRTWHEATVSWIQHGKQRDGGCVSLLDPNDAEQTGGTVGGGVQNSSCEVRNRLGKSCSQSRGEIVKAQRA